MRVIARKQSVPIAFRAACASRAAKVILEDALFDYIQTNERAIEEIRNRGGFTGIYPEGAVRDVIAEARRLKEFIHNLPDCHGLPLGLERVSEEQRH